MKYNFLFLLLLIGFGIIFDSCQKEISFENSVAKADAKGSLTDSSGNCLYDSVHGTFYNGVTPGSDTAYVEVQVKVDSVGAYRIYTDLQNGFMFADSGFFNATGINTIRLKPIGTPLLQTITDFTITFDSSTCNFTVNVQDSTGTGLGGGNNGGGSGAAGTWEFGTDSGGYFHGYIDTAVVAQDSTIWGSNGKMLYLRGFTSATSDSVLTLITYLPGGVIAPGNYNTQLVPSDSAAIYGFNFVNTGDPIYDAVPDNQSASTITITINSYNSSTHVVTGTFSGVAKDEAYYTVDATINIVNGKFTATVSP